MVSVWKKKKPQNNSVFLALGTSGNSQPTARCPLPKDACRIIFLGSKELVTCSHVAPLPAHTTCSAPPGYKLTTTGKCSALKNLCIDFPVLFVTSWHQRGATSTTTYFSMLLHYSKNAAFCNRLTDCPKQPEVIEASRRGTIFLETRYFILAGPTNMSKWKTTLVIDLIRW